MNGIFASSSSFISAPVTKTPENSLRQFNTHDHFVNLNIFSGNSHIQENATSLERGLIISPSGNTTSFYLEKIFSALIVQLIPLFVNFNDSLYISVAAYAND